MIHFGLVVNKAYEIPPDQLTDSSGQTMTVSFAGVDTRFEVITTVYANDLATDMNPERGNRRVSIGLILQNSTTGDAVIAIRGTEGIHEWMQDAQFLLVPCPFLVGAGLTEDGFTAVYRSFTTNPAPGSPAVVKALGGAAVAEARQDPHHLRPQPGRGAGDAARDRCGGEHRVHRPDGLFVCEPADR